jgi:phage terminase small subunit
MTPRTPEERAARRERFCQILVETARIRDAAAAAGFSPISAGVRGTEMLRRADVRARLTELLAERSLTATHNESIRLASVRRLLNRTLW